jgi:hypothetical protein
MNTKLMKLPENCLWLRIIRAKYPRAADIFSLTPARGSPFWHIIHKIKEYFKLGEHFKLGDGTAFDFGQIGGLERAL